MKLRLRGNSLRLRLSQREVAALAAGERVEEAVTFAPGERLVYALVPDDGAAASSLRARLAGGVVEVRAPAAVAREWASSERVGMEGEQTIGDGGVLTILVEKDFACLKPRANEDDTDAFPNPNETC